MKQILLFAYFVMAGSTAFSQIWQHQWLAGGSGTFSHTTSPGGSNTRIKHTTVSLTPDAGYFVINNLAIGARLGFYYEGTNNTLGDSTYSKFNTRQLSAAPFARYYFLKASSRINILADAAYNWYRIIEKGSGSAYHKNNKGYAFAVGPVWFISNASALELTAGYTHTDDVFEYHDVSVNIGFHQYFGKRNRVSKS